MENSNRIVPPHLNAEVYRTDTTGTSTQNYLEYIRLHNDGTILVGCSELTGRYWNGGVRIFTQNKEDNLNITSKKDICLNSGTADGCFVENSNKVLLCDDSGAVSVWSTNDDAWKQWTEDLTVAEHDDAVMAIDCLQPGLEYLTVGADGNIKVWDITDLICKRNYHSAHSKLICGVSVKPGSKTSFATASLDYNISLWDDNTTKPVLDLLNNSCGVRCLQWIDGNQLIFGDESGVVGIIDVRNPESVEKIAEFPAAVHKIVVQFDSDRAAICCDNKIVSVLDISPDAKPKLMYENKNLHTNFVRGVAWDLEDGNLLHSVGWDGELKRHRILLEK